MGILITGQVCPGMKQIFFINISHFHRGIGKDPGQIPEVFEFLILDGCRKKLFQRIVMSVGFLDNGRGVFKEVIIS